MVKRLAAFLLVLLFFTPVFSQHKDFIIHPLHYQTSGSLYKTVALLDSRSDTISLGFVHKGIFARKIRVIPIVAVSAQLQSVLDSLVDSTALNGQILFDLRRLRFSELAIGTRKTGSCHFHGLIYVVQGEKYYQIRTIDTLVTLQSKYLTENLFATVDKMITGFLESALLQEHLDSSYFTLQQVKKMDSIEKRSIPLYNVGKFKEGIYYNYRSFANQTPDSLLQFRVKMNSEFSIYTINAKGNRELVDPEKIYAVVHRSIPYISVDGMFYIVKKIKDDFYFAGRMKISKSLPVILGLEIANTAFFTGLFLWNNRLLIDASLGIFCGGTIAITPFRKYYTVKIDPMNGKFMRSKY